MLLLSFYKKKIGIALNTCGVIKEFIRPSRSDELWRLSG